MIIKILFVVIVIVLLKRILKIYISKKKKKEKIKVSIPVNPNNPAEILFQESKEALKIKDYSKAIDGLKKYLNINPFNEEAQQMLKKIQQEEKDQKKIEKKEQATKFEYALRDVRLSTFSKKKKQLSPEEAEKILISHVNNFVTQGFVTKKEADDFLYVNLELIRNGYCQFNTDINGIIIIYTNSTEYLLVNPTKEEYFEGKNIFSFDKWGIRKK